MRITCSPQKAVRKTGFLSHLYIKMNVLPRQARDKHRENSKKSGVFRRDWPDLQCGAGPRELHVTDVCEQVKPQRLCPLFFHSYETRCFYQDRLRTKTSGRPNKRRLRVTQRDLQLAEQHAAELRPRALQRTAQHMERFWRQGQRVVGATRGGCESRRE
jgi:hypothetical protein